MWKAKVTDTFTDGVEEGRAGVTVQTIPGYVISCLVATILLLSME